MGNPKDPTRTRRGTGHRPLPGEAKLSIVPATPDDLTGKRSSGSSSIDPVPPPDDLPDEAHEIWNAAMLELAGQRLKVADLEALRIMCTAAARARQAAAHIATYGLIVEGRKGPMVNPLVRIEKDAAATYKALAEQYGLTLASRLRLGLMQVQGQSMLSALNDDLDDEPIEVAEAAGGGAKKPKRSRAKKTPPEPAT